MTTFSSAAGAAPATSNPASPFIPLDPSFGVRGVIDNPAPAFFFRLTMVTQPDGRILIAGYVRDAPQDPLKLAVARFTADGRPDPTFGVGGTSVLGQPPFEPLVIRLAVQPGGQILVGRVVLGADQAVRWSILRLTATGRLDQSFSGDGGLQVSPANDLRAPLAGVVVGATGQITAVGAASGSACLARFLPDGAVDRRFGDEGQVVVGLPGTRASLSSATLDADGRLLVVGATTRPDSRSDVLVAAFGTDGRLDDTFGFRGSTLVDFGVGDDAGQRLVVQPDGNVLVGGVATITGGGAEPALLRLHPDGSLDDSFGVAGKHRLVTGRPPARTSVTALGLLSGGRIAVAGTYTVTTGPSTDPMFQVPQPFVSVLRESGAPDRTFAPRPLSVFVGHGSASASTDLAVVAGDKLLLATGALLRLNSTTTFSRLRLTLSANPNPAGPGPLQLTATITNRARSTAGGVLRLRASKAVTVVSGTNGSYTVDANRIDVVGKLQPLPPGATATLTLRTTVTGFEEGISLSGSVDSGQPDLDPSDNAAAILVTVARAPVA